MGKDQLANSRWTPLNYGANMTYWINLTGGEQPMVADGPHRIEQTAPSTGQQVFLAMPTTLSPQTVVPAGPVRDFDAPEREDPRRSAEVVLV